VAITHFEQAKRESGQIGHIQSTWSYLGDAAGSVGLGVNRIQVHDGSWSTPAHEHGEEEEIFYVLAGRGIEWRDGRSAPVGAGDCISYLPGEGAHTLHGVEGLDVLAFGLRRESESVDFPRLGLSRVGNRVVETEPGAVDGVPAQWLREAELGPPELPPEPGERPPAIVGVRDVVPRRTERRRVVHTLRDLGRAVGSVRVGLRYVELAPGKENGPPHCHSLEEEIFVVLDGDGVVVLGDEELDLVAGSVVARPPATGVAHMLRAGPAGLSYLACGTRENGDVCYYPRSNKIAFRGVGVIGRLQRLDYWDGEE
jgi:uncharacterized cupin superfamily protein